MTANALQTTDQTALSAPWSLPELPERLASLIATPLPSEYPPLSDVEEVAVIHALAHHAEHPGGSTPRQINKMMTKLSLGYPNSKLSVEEAGARLELYEEMLGDIDVDLLAAGFRAAVKKCKFFPSVSEIRELAMSQPPTPRMIQRYRLQALLSRHRYNPPAPPGPYATPEEIKAIKVEMGLENNELLNRIVGSEAA